MWDIVEFEEVTGGLFVGRAISTQGTRYGFSATENAFQGWLDGSGRDVLIPNGLRIAVTRRVRSRLGGKRGKRKTLFG